MVINSTGILDLMIPLLPGLFDGADIADALGYAVMFVVVV